MTDPRSTLGVVLAGGQSRRMGQDKTELMLGGRSLLQRAVGLLQSLGTVDVVVSGEREGYRCIADLHPGGGPLVGLFSVMQQRSGERLLVLPVDMPRLGVALLQHLLSNQREAAAAHYLGAVLPLRVDADPTAIAAAAELLSSDDRSKHSLRAFLERIGARPLALPPGAERAALDGCNTPEQWQAVAS